MPILGKLLFSAEGGQIAPETYTMLFTMHATVMIFLVIIPILAGAFGNFLIPLMIGAEDMAFPTLNMLSYWFMWPAFICFRRELLCRRRAGRAPAGRRIRRCRSRRDGADVVADRPDVRRRVVDDGLGQLPDDDHPDAGPRHDDVPPADDDLGDVHHRHPAGVRAAGAHRGRLHAVGRPACSAPASSFPKAGRANNALHAAGGGQPLLWQHLFWFYSHPAVYIMILPAMGMVSDIIACFARKPLFGYKPMVYSIAGIAGLGFIVWGHHMFVSGMNPVLGMTFMVATMIIALPSAIKVFNWLGTIWGGKIQFTTPMLFALSFVSMFIIGGLSGIFMAATPVDIFIHDTYFIVAHFHYVLFAGTAMGVFGAIYFWFPKMFGRMMNDSWGKVHFFLTFIFLNCVFYPMHILGMVGFPRRLADPYHYETFHHLLPLNQFMTWCAILMVAIADHLRRQFLLQHILRSAGGPESVAREHAGMAGPEPAGPRQLRFPTGRFTAARTNTARRKSTPITTRKPCRRRRQMTDIRRHDDMTNVVIAIRHSTFDIRNLLNAVTHDQHARICASPWPHRWAVVLGVRDVSAGVGRRPGDDDRRRHGRARLAEHVRLQLVSLSVADVARRAVGFVRRARPSAAWRRRWAC